MKKILFLTTTPTIGGNGDTLIGAAMKEAKEQGAEVYLIHIREKQIGFCRACYGCAVPLPVRRIRSDRKNGSACS